MKFLLFYEDMDFFLGEGLQLASDFQRDLVPRRVENLSRRERSQGVITGSVLRLSADSGAGMAGNGKQTPDRVRSQLRRLSSSFSPDGGNSMHVVPLLGGGEAEACSLCKGCSFVHTTRGVQPVCT